MLDNTQKNRSMIEPLTQKQDVATNEKRKEQYHAQSIHQTSEHDQQVFNVLIEQND